MKAHIQINLQLSSPGAFVSSRSLPGFAFLLGSLDSGSGADALNVRQTYRAEAVCAECFRQAEATLDPGRSVEWPSCFWSSALQRGRGSIVMLISWLEPRSLVSEAPRLTCAL